MLSFEWDLVNLKSRSSCNKMALENIIYTCEDLYLIFDLLAFECLQEGFCDSQTWLEKERMVMSLPV